MDTSVFFLKNWVHKDKIYFSNYVYTGEKGKISKGV